MFYFGQNSKNKLQGVHPDLVKVARRAINISMEDFSVTEGLRSIQRQKQLVEQGKSQTMNSRHITGHAIDLAPYPYGGDTDGDGIHNGADWGSYYPIAQAMIQAAKELKIPIRWGGNWGVHNTLDWKGTAKELAKAYTGRFPDGPHFELTRSYYP
jgi:peptidoglycan L-alanyl-D-glutamate endopeptidase CwlK